MINGPSDWQAMQSQALRLKRLFDERNQLIMESSWTNQELLLGFVTDIGDLVRRLMIDDERKPATPQTVVNNPQMLAEEFSDCLWSLIVLAEQYRVDLHSSFNTTIATLISETEREIVEVSKHRDLDI